MFIFCFLARFSVESSASLPFGPVCHMTWHAHVVVWHGGGHMSGGVRFPTKWQGVVVMRAASMVVVV
jgi:hypothetical protein